MQKTGFRHLYKIATTISILVAALCLMGACLYLFSSDKGFSREATAQVFHVISLPVYICLGLVVLGSLHERSPGQKAVKGSTPRQEWLILRRLRCRAQLTAWDKAQVSAVRKEQCKQRFHLGISLGLAVMTCIAFLAYLLSGDRFPVTDINSSVLGCLAVLAPCLAVCLAWALISGPKVTESRRREMDLLRTAPLSGKIPARTGGRNLRLLRLSLLAAAVFLLVSGLLAGGTMDVLTKAINICTECIGLG